MADNIKKFNHDVYTDIVKEALDDVKTENNDNDNNLQSTTSEETKPGIYDDDLKRGALRMFFTQYLEQFAYPPAFYQVHTPDSFKSPIDVFTRRTGDAEKKEKAEEQLDNAERDESGELHQVD